MTLPKTPLVGEPAPSKAHTGAFRRSKDTHLERVRAALAEERAHLDVRAWMATAITRVFPPLVGNRLRARALRFGGVSVGRATTFGGAVTLSGAHVGRRPAARLVIGERCWINAGCLFDASADITIADDVAIAQNVAFITNTHDIGPPWYRAGRNVSFPITVGSGTWIGTGAIVLPGVDIGPGCVVAAGAVVNRSVPANTLVAGVPARVVRALPDC